MSSSFASIEQAVADIAAGRPVVVVDDEDRENEGDLIFAAELATPELVAFMVRYTSGYICVPLTEGECDRLDLPPMHHTNQDRRGTAYTVTVDAREGISTGISAADRSHTIRLLAAASTDATDLARPGHVVPLRAREGGVLRRPGHTEAAVDLTRLAGLRPAGVLCELVNDDGTMMRLPDLEKFCAEHGLTLVTIADLIAHRRRTEKQVEQVAEARMPTPYGVFRALGYRAEHDPAEHVALVMGDLGDGRDVLVRVHSECLTGDVFGSLRCDCRDQLEMALTKIAEAGAGVLIYEQQEGRGIGLMAKLQAYALQDSGLDTVEANERLGFKADHREFALPAEILKALGITQVKLLSNNPDKVAALERAGVHVVERVPCEVAPSEYAEEYLKTKKEKLGHLFTSR
jgi:3,4-dihydroxy 2-butanone 4-phosphate synthase / GTP cyclohydrolase II